MNRNWHGILIIDEIKQIRDGSIVFQKNNLYNILHTEGEARLLNALFAGGSVSNQYIPNYYYVGLDNRTTLSQSNTYSSITGEPAIATGYSRQQISSLGGFTIEETSTSAKAKSNLLGFSATTSSWGPVKNLFLTNVNYGTTSGGILYSSTNLGSSITVAAGDTISLRFTLALRNC